MKSLVLVLSFSLFLALCPRAQAQIVAWEISGSNASTASPLAAATRAAGVASAQLSLGSGVSASSANDTFGASGFNSLSLADAITANQYLRITIAPEAGQAISFTSLSFLTGLSSVPSAGDFHGALLSGATGFTAADALHTYAFNTTTAPLQTATLSGEAGLQGLTTATEFRLYGWRDTSGTSTFRFRSLTGYDVAIQGTISAVPEPSTYALIAGTTTLAGVLLFRRRRPRR